MSIGATRDSGLWRDGVMHGELGQLNSSEEKINDLMYR